MTGLFGVAAKDCSKELFYGTDYHSHCAANWAGVALYVPSSENPAEKIFRKSHQIGNVQFKAEFSDIRKLSGKYGLGVLSNERQPICKKSKLGNIAVATDSTIFNLENILEKLFANGATLSEASFEQVNQTEVVSQLICQKSDIVDGLEYAVNSVDGFCSALLLTENGIYVARDRHGMNTLILGKRDDGAFAVASETSAFPNLHFKIEKYLEPGEILYFNENGYEVKKKGDNSNLRHCIFDWIYFSDPSGMHEGVNVEKVRNRCGAELAEMEPADFDADIASGVPDSGTGHAVGYANKSGIPFGRPLIKYGPGWSKSYVPATQERREEIAYYKIIPLPSLIEGMRLVIVDDSIRRGTQLRNLIHQKVLPYKPKEVHVRIASPPQLFPCIRDKADVTRLATRRAIHAIEGKDIDDFSEYMDSNSEKYAKMVDYIRQEIGATTLSFITLDAMVRATGKPKDGHCLYCWTGKF